MNLESRLCAYLIATSYFFHKLMNEWFDPNAAGFDMFKSVESIPFFAVFIGFVVTFMQYVRKINKKD